MGEMMKFGIKMALVIACAGALVAALLILYNVVTSATIINQSGVSEMFRIVSLVMPLNMRTIFTLLSTLFSFKVAYWAADKMIQFIEALG